jgi:hypothetical protein
MSISKYVWIGRDNEFVIRMDSTDGAGVTEPANMSTVTSLFMELRKTDGSDGPAVTVDKDEASAVINWWDLSLGQGEVIFKLGLWAEVFDPTMLYKVRITLFTAASPNGIVWSSYGDSKLTPMSLTFFETA